MVLRYFMFPSVQSQEGIHRVRQLPVVMITVLVRFFVC